MRAIDELERARTSTGSVLTIGTFDGVHRGHRRVVELVAKDARDHGLQAGVLTFIATPRETLRASEPVAYLSDLEERIVLLREAGADFVAPITFDMELAGLSARDFAESLVEILSLKRLVVGPDFAMGRRREGTIPVLTELGAELGFTVTTLDEVVDGSQRIGSSAIRRLIIEDGDVEAATSMLARPYSLSGQIVHGHHRGKDLGFPTANMTVPARRAVPADGIYITRAYLGSEALPSVTNVGDNPTFQDAERMVETFILDFDQDIYGREMRVEFLKRLRGEETFDSVDALVVQMHRDIQQARDYFGQAD